MPRRSPAASSRLQTSLTQNTIGGLRKCPRIVRRRRSPRTRSPTAPTSTRSSARTDPDTVTLIANYIPLEAPAGGPNFYEFGDDVLYEIHIDNDGDGKPTSPTSSGSRPRSRNPNTFLYNTGPITSLDEPELEPPPVLHGDPDRPRSTAPRCSGTNLTCPPCNIGPRSTPELRGAGRGGGPHARRRQQGVRRPARRGLLRRPRRDLRPRRPAAVPEPAPRSPIGGRRSGVDATDELQRALDRHPGADHAS